MAAATAAGLLTSWLAGAVRAQEATVTQLPKLAVGALTFAATFRWMSGEVVGFFSSLLGG